MNIYTNPRCRLARAGVVGFLALAGLGIMAPSAMAADTPANASVSAQSVSAQSPHPFATNTMYVRSQQREAVRVVVTARSNHGESETKDVFFQDAAITSVMHLSSNYQGPADSFAALLIYADGTKVQIYVDYPEGGGAPSVSYQDGRNRVIAWQSAQINAMHCIEISGKSIWLSRTADHEFLVSLLGTG